MGLIFLQCSCNAGANMGIFGSKATSKSKISNLWSKLLIKENIASFYVSVNNFHS